MLAAVSSLGTVLRRFSPALAVPLLFLPLWSGTAGATCPVTTSTVPAGVALDCQTVELNGVSSTDIAVFAGLLLFAAGCFVARAFIGRGA